MALHWGMAAVIVIAFAIGWVMTDLPISPLRLKAFNYHKWLGVTVLLLLLLRVAWRLLHAPPPALPMSPLQALAAKVVHGLLYGAMLLQPLTGWAYSNAAGFPVVYLKLVPLPNLVQKNPALADVLKESHELLAWGFVLLLGLHVAGALHHHFILRDATLDRMRPTRLRS